MAWVSYGWVGWDKPIKYQKAFAVFLLRAGLSAFLLLFGATKRSPKTAMHPSLFRVLSLVFRSITALNQDFQSISLSVDCAR